ncbi:MAG: hypothetical protein JO287_21440 [Pseudonocardiales bacterium]|nr:hypothetical protein [Pseudonocardiales bacterium]
MSALTGLAKCRRESVDLGVADGLVSAGLTRRPAARQAGQGGVGEPSCGRAAVDVGAVGGRNGLGITVGYTISTLPPPSPS